MPKMTNILTALAIVVTVITTYVGVRVAYDIADRGSTPPKRLAASYFGGADLVSDLADSQSNVSITITEGKTKIDRVSVVQVELQNVGRVPIMSADMDKPPYLVASKPWRIGNVVNSEDAGGLPVTWARVNDQEFTTGPTLINPTEKISATVYLTLVDDNKDTKFLQPSIAWNARVANMAQIENLVEVYQARKGGLRSFFDYTFYGSIVFLITYTSLSTFGLAWGVYFIEQPYARVFPALYAVSLLLLSLAFADSIVYYLSGKLPWAHSPNDYIYKAPPPFLYMLLILGTFVRSFVRRRNQAAIN